MRRPFRGFRGRAGCRRSAERQRLGGKRVDLLLNLLVGVGAVHLHAGLSPGDFQRLIGRNLLAGQCLGRTAHHPPVALGVALEHRNSPPVLQHLEQPRQVHALAGLGQRRLVRCIERGAFPGHQSSPDSARRGTRPQRVPARWLLVVGVSGGHVNTLAVRADTNTHPQTRGWCRSLWLLLLAVRFPDLIGSVIVHDRYTNYDSDFNQRR